MTLVVLTCALLVALTTTLHYESLRLLNGWLPRLRMPQHPRLLVVILVAFVAHAIEILMYGGALYLLVRVVSAGVLSGTAPFTLSNCLYFSAETYTSLGFGDITPMGSVRLLAGVEALNGLLLIGWTASFTYLAMERFWSAQPPRETP